MTPKTIVFLDLDNTFWSDSTGVPDSALEAIRGAQANGHRVFSNTGRARAGTRDLMEFGLDGRSYAAGAEVFVGDKKVVDEPLDLATSLMLRDLLDIGRGILIAEGGERCYIRPYDREYFQELFDLLASFDDPFIDHPDISEMREEDHVQLYKYSLFVRGGVPQEVIDAVPEGFHGTTMGDATEFTRVGVSKATSLETVRRYYLETEGMRYRTMALGDSGNDIPMLRAADVSVCMGNGTDAAKAVSDYVTRDIGDDGLYHAFEHFGLLDS